MFHDVNKKFPVLQPVFFVVNIIVHSGAPFFITEIKFVRENTNAGGRKVPLAAMIQ